MPVTSAYIMPHGTVVIPELGWAQEKECPECKKMFAACMEAARRIAADAPEVIVLATPHSVSPLDDVHISLGAGVETDLQKFGAKESIPFKVTYDTELAAEIERLAVEGGVFKGSPGDAAPEIDHGTLMPLYFADKCYPGCKAVRISVTYGFSREGRVRLGRAVSAAVKNLNRRAVFIASADLAHTLDAKGPYGYAEEGAVFDARICELMGKADLSGMLAMDPELSAKAKNCGQRTIFVMAGAVEELELEADFLGYDGNHYFGFAACCYKVTGSAPGRDYLAGPGLAL